MSNRFTAEEALAMVKTDYSRKEIEQFNIIKAVIDKAYLYIEIEISRNGTETIVPLGKTSLGLLTSSFVKYDFNFDKADDKSCDVIIDYFESKGFKAYFTGFRNNAIPMLHISWEENNNKISVSDNLSRYLKYIGEVIE